LTTKEAQLLQLLAENPGRIFSRDSLLKMIWGYADGVTSRTVDVHIQRLRKKLKGNLEANVHTIFGRGYVLEQPGQQQVQHLLGDNNRTNSFTYRKSAFDGQ